MLETQLIFLKLSNGFTWRFSGVAIQLPGKAAEFGGPRNLSGSVPNTYRPRRLPKLAGMTRHDDRNPTERIMPHIVGTPNYLKNHLPHRIYPIHRSR